MIEDKDIHLTYGELDDYITIEGKFELTVEYTVDAFYKSYATRTNMCKGAEKQIKREILNKIYGDLRQKIKETYVEAMQLVGYNPYSKYEDLEKLRKMFGELLDMTKIDENKVEQDEN